jgi:hypothetical protein
MEPRSSIYLSGSRGGVEGRGGNLSHDRNQLEAWDWGNSFWYFTSFEDLMIVPSSYLINSF